ncbi:hypothetical protein BDV59DRAFT_147148 [Aspergillus ambiguus]|uniref:uncharacterized protein n=1 Tax=Aspergillus ambiguus TaxID=176160 RepID=UPI003CCDFE2A
MGISTSRACMDRRKGSRTLDPVLRHKRTIHIQHEFHDWSRNDTVFGQLHFLCFYCAEYFRSKIFPHQVLTYDTIPSRSCCCCEQDYQELNGVRGIFINPNQEARLIEARNKDMRSTWLSRRDAKCMETTIAIKQGQQPDVLNGGTPLPYSINHMSLYRELVFAPLSIDNLLDLIISYSAVSEPQHTAKRRIKTFQISMCDGA